MYRFTRGEGGLRIFFGGDLAAVSGKAASSLYSASGFAAGAFGGVELRLTRRIAVGVDAGPYLITLKEKKTKLSSSGLDFVLNTCAVFYLF
jgi:hypothetical protein